MSTPAPLTYESLLEIFRQTDERLKLQFQDTDERLKLQFQDTDERMQRDFQASRQENDKQFRKMKRGIDKAIEATNKAVEASARQLKILQKEIGSLGTRVGDVIEKMVEGNIVTQFQELGYDITDCYENRRFGDRGTSNSGEIDLILEDGDTAILIEVKTHLKIAHVKDHLKRMEKYRRHIDAKNRGFQCHYIGAVAGTVVADNVVDYAHEKGLYVIIQSARSTEVLPQPAGFVPQKW